MSFLPAPSSLPGSPQPPSYLPAAAELEAAGDDMAPTLRSSPTSASARRRKTAAELLTAEEDAAASRERAERTKRGCWTCRIRRKKCDEEQEEERCATCRRLGLECMGWGIKRPEWMKDKKAVDNKRAEIKHQLASQNLIRGQARNAHHLHHQQSSPHTRHTPSSSLLAVPDSRSRRANVISSSTLPSSPSSPPTSRASSRPQRAAAIQANHNLGLYHSVGSSSTNVSGYNTSGSDLSRAPSPSSALDDEDEDASGEEDNYSGPFQGHHDFDNDSEMANGRERSEGPPRLQQHTRASTSEPSFADSPLPSSTGGYPDEMHYTSGYSIHGMSDDGPAGNLGMIAGDATLPGFGSDFGYAAYNPQGYLDAFSDNGLSAYGASDFDLHSSTLQGMMMPSAAVATTKEMSGVSMGGGMAGMSMQSSHMVPQVPPLDLEMDMSSSDMSSSGPLTSPIVSSSSSGGMGLVGLTVTSPTGVTIPAEGAYPNSYFPGQSMAAVAPQVATVTTFTMAPPAPVTTTVASQHAANGTRSPQASVSPQQHPRGFYPQPPASTTSQRHVAAAPPANSNFATSSVTPQQQPQQQNQQPQQQQQAEYNAAALVYSPGVRKSLTDRTRSLSNFQETLIFYYFNRGVRRMQYLLADDSTTGVTDVMYDLVIRDPLGPVTNAICSLAALHDTRLRIAHGLIHPEDPRAHDSAQRLYSDTVVQLSKKAGAFTDVEAIASLHLLSFWLFCGGGGDWASALGLAGDWLMRSELMQNTLRDPMDILAGWKPAKRFAAQSTLWFDILGGCSMRQAPRFMSLFRRLKKANRELPSNGQHQQPLFSSGGGANMSRTSSQQQRKSGASQSLMDSVMGCDDDIMFAIASIAELAQWKEEEQASGRLSFRDLVDRGRAIEEELMSTKVVFSPVGTNGTSPATSPISPGLASPTATMSPLAAFGSGHAKPMPSVWDPYNASTMISAMPPTTASGDAIDPTWGNMGIQHRSVSLTSPPALHPQMPSSASRASSPGSAHSGGVTPGPLSVITNTGPITLRQLCSNVFREAAFLYLYTVVSGCEPAVNEISNSVTSLIAAICAIPSTDLDRSLAFPITLGGCLSDLPEQREFFAGRLAEQGSAVGNGSQAKLLMETVWRRRDAGEKGVCWRDTMKDLGFDLLLV